MVPTVDNLDEYERSHVYDDGTLVRISIRRTQDDAYPSGWRYTLHYGKLTPDPETLDDGTIRRYDNAHEDTKGHERHVAPDPEPEYIDFPGMEKLYEQFWNEIPKQRFTPSSDNDTR
ncbi:toxin-antitoxin system TumE family protein [Halorussus salinisoli]|uniref:toxin-antitoxin system TumE family protein n=1 Tax=Halorussus salinisoli TaxID=2558242 RepID=UPI0010C176BF|nr:DUF6516 family protein [Halorussus salinisoli]